ncbi:MAG: hypothetical protein EOQ69_22535 [Mesorhizobium sp.]|nr:MAG: hypothetical protein EOQ69_22535 [Mesorhizobium sp.]RWG81336.1 MAG: hypothetical protein EOQ70_25535 [Mesorhizobium sp.]RWK04180.1 MAG: hypothetical protein EOR42_17255 [Mesorhizobium sp.]RWK08360.1 MAG: hypothetical protein EOR39_19550 [Mesorhizobium sp.]RWK15247.1 MAG: hypothetical protein EOR41_23980 [Mesorhizobium sp.]
MSDPDPPSTVSKPLPPLRVSSPDPPFRRSLPAPPYSKSSPLPPTRLSLLLVPTVEVAIFHPPADARRACSLAVRQTANYPMPNESAPSLRREEMTRICRATRRNPTARPVNGQPITAVHRQQVAQW